MKLYCPYDFCRYSKKNYDPVKLAPFTKIGSPEGSTLELARHIRREHPKQFADWSQSLNKPREDSVIDEPDPLEHLLEEQISSSANDSEKLYHSKLLPKSDYSFEEIKSKLQSIRDSLDAELMSKYVEVAKQNESL